MSQTFGTAYYIAPEVLTTDYNEKCDVWSVGVILYILLSGRPPFDGKDDKEIVKKVRIGKFSTTGPEWKGISKDAIDLIKKMLSYDPCKRIGAVEALEHQWIKKKVHSNTDMKGTISALQNLRGYRVSHVTK
jgi:calcium-dependent protein kinase